MMLQSAALDLNFIARMNLNVSVKKYEDLSER